MKALGFVNEENTGFGVVRGGFEMKRYDYRLTADGELIASRIKGTADYEKITDAAERMIAAGNPNYVTLSIAAKAFFILRNRGQGMSTQEIVREAQKFDWEITPDSLDNAVRFLERLNIVKRGSSEN